MSLITIEVEIDHGRVTSLGSEPLPEKATGLLTLLTSSTQLPICGSVSDFIEKRTGAFSLPESSGNDPRLADLLAKHMK